MNKPQRPQIQVDLGEKEAEGIYANFAIITHSASEFIVDFARLLPGLPKSKVFARIIMTPQNAKALQRTLQTNVERFEQTHGEIKLSAQPGATSGQNAGIGFQSSEE
ncbi:MAG: DUF3467 domain-containing protein [Candidatus Krumholzibacteriia bacterium]